MAGPDDILKQLLAVFATEAEEHLAAISSGLLALEQAPSPERRQELVETIFREVHTLKGASRAVNLGNVVAICHTLENVFAALKLGKIALAPELLDLLHQGFTHVKAILARGDGSTPPERAPELRALMDCLAAAATGAPLAAPPVATSVERGAPAGTDQVLADGAGGGARSEAPARAPTPPAAALPTIRVSTAKLDALLHQAEELISAKLAAARLAAELDRLAAEVAGRGKARERRRQQIALTRSGPALRANGGAAQRRVVGASGARDLVEQDDQAFRSLAVQIAALAAAARHDLRWLGKMVDSLLESAKQVLMVPFSALLDPLPQLVRDLARSQGKEAELVISGEDLEIDRRIQEEMKDALLHFVRNAIDHGIEMPAERARKGKPARGTIAIAIVQHASGKAEIAISDDGAGIDGAKVREAASRLGMAAAEDEGRTGEALLLSTICRSGFTTSPLVTDISGRGLGLAIVQEKVEKLGGLLALESRPGAGTTFRVVLPITLASFRGVVVEVGAATFILPTGHVERVLRVPSEEIATVEGRETIRLDGRTVCLVHLGDVLELPGPAVAPIDHRTVIVLAAAGERIGFVVDAIREEQEVLMKGLGPQLARVRNLAGAAVLASGALALILNVRDLMRSAVAAPQTLRSTGKLAAAAARRKSILIAEDSITARTLFKHVLEAAGYHVKTAVDGVDAWTSLHTEDFDLIVSDVEMPGMGGFDLTARIRDDQKLHELPVILLTSRGSREDRERGIDAGANAYLVKDQFDQNNLLDLVGHLI